MRKLETTGSITTTEQIENCDKPTAQLASNPNQHKGLIPVDNIPHYMRYPCGRPIANQTLRLVCDWCAIAKTLPPELPDQVTT